MRSNIWELEEAQKALDNGNATLAGRYLSKALECVRCMYCHGPLGGTDYHSHFKGYVHDECADKYAGRGDYERRNEEDGAEFSRRFPYADERS